MNMLRRIMPAATSAVPGVTGLARAARDVGGATLGSQLAYSQLGAASRPDDPMAGAQTYAIKFQKAAQSIPVVPEMIPGSRGVIGSATGIVPATLGMADIAGRYAARNFMEIDREKRIRDEAARRALRGQQ